MTAAAPMVIQVPNKYIDDDFQLTRASLENARHLPGWAYTSADIYKQEKEKIFMSRWLCVGRLDEIPNPGDFFTLRIMSEPVLIVRNSDGEVGAFSNVCRHRGVEIAQGSGNAKRFSCPYHAWTYDLAGRLVGAPHMKKSSVDLGQCKLPRLNLEIWRGWIFICFSNSPLPFDRTIAAFENEYGFLRSDKCRLADKVVFELKCNWKFVVENHMDIYHVGTVHAKTTGRFYKGRAEDYAFNLLPDGGYSSFFEAAPLAKDGKSLFGKMSCLEEKPDTFATLGLLRPNMNWSARSDNMRMWITWPISPNQSRLVCYTLFPEEKFEDPEFKEKVFNYSNFLRAIIAEDQEMIESLQNGVDANTFSPGPLSFLERPIHHAINSYMDDMGF
jgi:Rieske 2Fe-2S family protein